MNLHQLSEDLIGAESAPLLVVDPLEYQISLAAPYLWATVEGFVDGRAWQERWKSGRFLYQAGNPPTGAPGAGTAINGKPTLGFDGAKDGYVVSDTDFPSGIMSMAWVAITPATTGTFSIGKASSAGTRVFIRTSGATEFYVNSVLVHTLGSDLRNASPHLHAVGFDDADNRLGYYVDGVNQVNLSSVTDNTGALGSIAIGASGSLGNADRALCSIAEVWFFNYNIAHPSSSAALAARLALKNYVNSRYAMSVV